MIHQNQRIGIFVDVQNVYHSAKNLYRARVNFSQLIKTLSEGRILVRAIAYVVKSEGVPGYEVETREDSFFEALKKSGLELRMKDLQIYHGGAKKADWDVGMAVDAIRMAGSLDVVILVTGDGDFIPLVEYLKWGAGKQVEIAGFSRTASLKLKESSDAFIELESIPKILLKIGRSQKRKK